MRYGSVCSGIEAASVAWESLGWTPAWFCEIDPFPSAVLKARFPNVPNYGDFTKMIEPDHEVHRGEPIDLLVGGTPCFPGNVRVLTSEGSKPISDVRVGDQVLTDKGRYRPVLAVGSRIAPTIRIKGQGAEIVTTHEHPFLSRSYGKRWDNERRSYARHFGDEEWTDAKDMKGRFWASITSYPELPMPPLRTEGREEDLNVAFTPAFFYFVGMWVGNGWTRITPRRGAVLLADAHESASEVASRLSDTGLSFTSATMKTATRFQIASRPLARWLEENFNKGASTKRIPAWVLGLPDAERKAFLDGYLFADGHRMKKPSGLAATTTSPDLALGISCLFWSFGRSVTRHVPKSRRGDCVIEGRQVSEKPYFQIHSPDHARSSVVLDGKRWGLVRSVEETGREETVYNIEVADDHTYTADGIVVHNCQDFSVAGLRAGIEGARGQLTLSFLHLARILRPRWILWENVPGVLSANDGRAFGAFLGGLQELGYGFAWRVLDAQYVRVDGYPRAVPQRRRRVFVVGCAGGDWLRAASVLLEPEGVRGNPAPRREARKEAPSALGYGAAGGRGADGDLGGGGRDGGSGGGERDGGVNTVAFTTRGREGGLSVESQEELSYALKHPGAGGRSNDRMIATKVDSVVRPVAGTLDANYGKGPGERGGAEREYVAQSQFWNGADVAETLTCTSDDQRMPDKNRMQVVLQERASEPPAGGFFDAEPQVFGFQQRIARNGRGATGDIVNALNAQSGGTGRGDAAPCVAQSVPLPETVQGMVVPYDLCQVTAPFNSQVRDAASPCHTLAKGNTHLAAVVSTVPLPETVQRMVVRRLTPVECERLQGFPDGWTQIAWKGKPAADCPDGGRYKALGNSMAVNCMRWIGRRIVLVDEVFGELEALTEEAGSET